MHKKIGILGGLSPESTVTYYEYITRTYTERHGDYGYPEIIIYSVNFQKYVDWQRAGAWEESLADMIGAARALERAGADFGLIATNTMHLVYDRMQEAVGIPFLHIVDAVAAAVRERGQSTVGLLGTTFTMNGPIYPERLGRGGIDVLVPPEDEQEALNEVIYGELVRGVVRDESRRLYLSAIERLTARGAQGVVLGCTEIPLLVKAEHCDVPLYDSTIIHAEQALRYALGQ